MLDSQAAVTNTDDEAKKPGAEVTSDVQDTQDNELDELLKEFEETGEEPDATEDKTKDVEKTTKDEKQSGSDTDEVVEYVRQQKARDREALEREVQEEYKKTVKEIKGDLPYSDKVVSGFLKEMAAEDKRVLNAYANRQKNPEAWGKVVETMRRQLVKEVGSGSDSKTTDTRSQVAEAIRNAKSSNGEVSDKAMHELNDTDFTKALDDFIKS